MIQTFHILKKVMLIFGLLALWQIKQKTKQINMNLWFMQFMRFMHFNPCPIFEESVVWGEEMRRHVAEYQGATEN